MPRDREDDSERITSERPTGGKLPKAGGQPGEGIPKTGAGQELSKTGATPPAGTTPSGGARTYTVKPGDSLSKIAKELYGDAGKWKQIYEANKGVIGGNPDLIKPGQVLTIP